VSNLTITFRGVGKKRADEIQKDLIGLMEKHNVKSSGMEHGGFDINDRKTYQKIQNEPDYILQFDDDACQLITLLNACIYKTGKSPIQYKSDEFEDLVNVCGGICGYLKEGILGSIWTLHKKSG